MPRARGAFLRLGRVEISAMTLSAALTACAGTTPERSEIGRSSAPPDPDEPKSANDEAPVSPSAEDTPHPPDEAPPQAAALEVPEFGAAIVVPPSARSRPAPILVAAHGAGDSPEWQCEHWGAVARGRYFVLCP